jgi:hypothetical protein
VYATHLRAAEIFVRRISCNSNTYEITLTIYVNLEHTQVAAGGSEAILFFGDGSSISIPELTNIEIVDAENEVGKVTFKTIHTYSANGRYVIAFREPNRNGGVLNYDNSGTTVFYTETAFTLQSNTCNSSPLLSIPPMDRACKGITFYHNAGARDLDNDSLSYELVTPLRDLNTPVANYQSPVASKFYSTPYTKSNEEKNGPPKLFIDATGTITWDAAGTSGEYGIAIKIKEWKYNPTDSSWSEIGYVIRDMQILVSECLNLKPILQLQSELCVIAGTLIDITGIGLDPNFDPVSIEAFSEVFSLPVSPAQILPAGAPLQSTLPPNDTASVRFRWQTTCDHARSYSIVFKITDNPAAGPRLIFFKTITIKVIAPEPKIDQVTINPVSKSVKIQWEDYGCADAKEYQVWRRISKIDYVQPDCSNGMPKSPRYQFLAIVAGDQTSFIDSELSLGAQYCYRVVALVGPNKTASRISRDTCFIPKPAEAPVITNASVEKTHVTNGEVFLKWTSPYEIDRQQYPPPYRYQVWEGKQDGAVIEFHALTNTSLADTVFQTSASSTLEKLFYKIVLYVPTLTNDPIDTSSIASTVLLKTKSLANSIELTWEATTPWYNYTPVNHQIYRSTSMSGDFTQIGSVDVNENDFYYVDNDPSLAKDAIYYYKVLTRGTYGNPDLPEPLDNFSQITGAEILDVEPPCTPVLVVNNSDCAALPCGSEFFNSLSWNPPDVGCPQDVVVYELVVRNNDGENFTSLGPVSSPYVHDKIQSMAKCYRLIAIDNAGNKSDSSEVVCNDNCPSFSLTNVFTPGQIDNLNDNFTAYEEVEAGECSRFVKRVSIQIFDRWGRVIHSAAATNNPMFIFWNGETDSGRSASAGIYYYNATVTFDVRDQRNAERNYKGWLHLVR